MLFDVVGLDESRLEGALGDIERDPTRATAAERSAFALCSPTRHAIVTSGQQRCWVAAIDDGQRSSGRRPTSHQASGKAAPAIAALARSQTRNGVIPSATASDQLMPVTTLSQGTPTA